MMKLTVEPVTIEHHREPLGIGESRPRISWITTTDQPGWRQTGYEVEIRDRRGATDSTGRVSSRDSVLLPWPGQPLGSREWREVRVRVWGPGEGLEPSPWSEPTALETGLLHPSDWSAQLVSPQLPVPGADGEPAALLRREFSLDGPVTRARIYVTAHGIFELEVNGCRVGEDLLAPGWTSYPHRLRYHTYDVTSVLLPGRNVLGAHLADGWYRGFLGFGGRRGIYGDRTALALQLEVEHPGGCRTTVVTDPEWRSSLGPIVRADLYQGQTHDFRLEQPGWSTPGFDDQSWAPVDPTALETARLVAPAGPPVRPQEVVEAGEVTLSPSGRILVDFGQNLVGHLRVRLPSASPGTTISFRHAEVLEHGELGTRPLRAAIQTDRVILDGAGPRVWEPRLTSHGFRYVEVDGWPGAVCRHDLAAVVAHTDLRRAGTFACSDQLVTRLHENVVWSARGNLVDLPTDCPQRDERLGWTGDLQIFAPTAAFLFDCAGMLTGWLADLAADQDDAGIVPPYVPFVELDPDLPPAQAEAGWGDAAVVLPWVLYQRYGDVHLLGRQWDSMVGWVEALAARAGDEVDFPGGGFSFGDWLDADAPDDQPWKARVPWQLVAAGYLARSAGILASAAEVLDRPAERRRYAALAERVTEAFRREYVTGSGRLAYPAQTAYALAIAFDLLEPAQRQHAGDLLADQVAADGYRIGTGFLGTPLVCDALTATGHVATAHALLLQRECPSWLYPVTMGATTIWERWNSMLPDGSINPGTMTSFNHYALGSIADWLHRVVAGLAPAEPGYRRLRVAPQPGPVLTWARADHETPYGRASVEWRREGDQFTLTALVPPNTEAEVLLPDGSPSRIAGPGQHHLSCALTREPPPGQPAR